MIQTGRFYSSKSVSLLHLGHCVTLDPAWSRDYQNFMMSFADFLHLFKEYRQGILIYSYLGRLLGETWI